MSHEPTFHSSIATPLGAMELVTRGPAIIGLDFDAPAFPPQQLDATAAALADDVRRALDRYFARRLTSFSFTLAPQGTPFQQAVWTALCEIPFGKTVSYADIARRLGMPTAVRAVGAANGRNPIAILIPCHRVIGANGKLVGYAGGLPRKRALLALEAPSLLSQFAA